MFYTVELLLFINKLRMCLESHFSGHISGEVAVGSELQVAAISCSVVYHINLS